MSDQMNYYDVFGISPTASKRAINAKHKALAKRYHPDINSSEDAHERMTMLNKAHEVLSDTAKRKEYDKELKLNQQQNQNRDISSTRAVRNDRPYDTRVTEQRTEKAELLRRKTEARLRTEDAARTLRKEQEQQKDKEASQKSRQVRVDVDKQHVVNVLSDLVMGGNTQREKMMDFDEERHHATKVLLSLVRNDDSHLKRRAEEAERKQHIDEILELVKVLNAEKDKNRYI